MAEALEIAAKSFAQIFKAKLQVFRSLVTGDFHNSKVVGDYVEALVRSHIGSLIEPMRICNGSLYYPSAKDRRIMQHDGLVWQPCFGAPLLQEGEFLFLHPNTVGAVVEIKASVQSLQRFHSRLVGIAEDFLVPSGHNKRHAIGIVVGHQDPDRASKPKWNKVNGHLLELYCKAENNCPIFILFQKKGDQYKPYLPGIKGMLVAFHYLANERPQGALA